MYFSNMQGELRGLKTLILNETPSAYCIHCFAHQLQLTLVALAKKHSDVDDFFCEVHTGRGLNQERGLQRPGDTRWGSHYRTLDNLIVLFSSIIHVLEFVAREGPNYADRLVAESLMTKIKEFEFVFMLHLMWKVLMMTNDLSSSLQRMDQDIVNAMRLLTHTKQRLQRMRNSEFQSLMDNVSSFCDKHEIMIPKMDALYFPGKSKRRSLDVTYSHHLHVEIFNGVIDLHLQELRSRFDAVSTDLLLGMASLNPLNSFGNFDKNRIMKLAEYYPNEFDSNKLRDLSFQLDSFIVYARCHDKRFFNMKGISDLSKVLVKSDLHQTWPLVYLLIKLTLILPVATASVERAFSSMNYIKNELRNTIGAVVAEATKWSQERKLCWVRKTAEAEIWAHMRMRSCEVMERRSEVRGSSSQLIPQKQRLYRRKDAAEATNVSADAEIPDADVVAFDGCWMKVYLRSCCSYLLFTSPEGSDEFRTRFGLIWLCLRVAGVGQLLQVSQMRDTVRIWGPRVCKVGVAFVRWARRLSGADFANAESLSHLQHPMVQQVSLLRCNLRICGVRICEPQVAFATSAAEQKG
ncbi:PREDICTED: uncharacterized protein LOC109236055 [Nicotiana attenuata]|uniref:uncharacterized protein LOC109236055 n=1 Tax=Nicotiana attenuata TaxID=49451 RepID=UPI00090521DD|nr:PREDICTED: uncharacterized protein LOC109236055 [Nicotiana attenuata]